MSVTRRLFRALLRPRLPLTSGTATVVGIDGPLRIDRDRWHVPHVAAGSETDAWYGLGFVQGQDRAFQITSFVHVAAGRLAELTGRDGLPVDRLMRRLGLHHRARQQLAELDPDVRGGIEAFARGVTAGMTVGSPRPAVEFTLLRTRPRPMTAVDVLAIVKLFAFLLAANWQDELARLLVLERDGPEALRRLDERATADLPTTLGHPEGPAMTALAADLDVLSRWLPVGGASNNWVLSGAHTRSGAPLVANDPHLSPVLPPLWYLAHLRCPAWAVAGAALPGTPSFAAGHNGFGAWGVTAGHCDETDLFLEELDGTRVRTADGWVEGHVRREVVVVRGGRDEVIEVVVTPRGPIVGPALDGARDGLSIAGTWLEGGPVGGFLRLPAARSVAEFHEAFRAWPGMSLNVVWGDRNGHIAWQLAGDLPVRGCGNGTVPLPGWDPQVGWRGRVPFDDLPRLADPPDGRIATANNAPAPHASRPFLGVDHLEGYRVAAIHEVLAERDDWDVEATFRAQRDTRSLPWRRAKAVLVDQLRPEDPAAALGWGLLRGWDGDVSADSPAAAVFELTMAALRRRVVATLAPRAANDVMTQTPVPGLVDHALLGLRGTAHTLAFLEDPGGVAFDTRREVEVALADAVQQLRRHGRHLDDWAWGRVRPLRLRHPVSGSAPALRAVFDRGPFPLGGDAHTIPQASSVPADPLGDPLGVVSLRMAVDLSDVETARFCLPGGQSGDPTSRHYDDQLALFLRGQGIPIAWSDEAVAAARVATLELVPPETVESTSATVSTDGGGTGRGDVPLRAAEQPHG